MRKQENTFLFLNADGILKKILRRRECHEYTEK